MTEWVRLKRGNDWGVSYLAVEPKRDGFADSTRKVEFAAGTPLHVRWPDGTESTEPAAERVVHGTVGDMGHTYDTTSHNQGIEVNRNGVMLFVSLADVDIDRADLAKATRGAELAVEAVK